MIWLGLLLLGLGIADLLHSGRPLRWMPEILAALVTVGAGLLAGYSDASEVLGEVAVAFVVLAWGSAVRQGFGRRLPGLPLSVLALAVVGAVLVSPLGDSSGGPLGDWLSQTEVPWLRSLDVTRAVLLLGAFVVQGSTGNVVVRLILQATHTVPPAPAEQREAGPRLKGGRLLGPMERLIIVGLGLSGSFTAIGIIVAAKGLLRFPELQAARDAHEGPSITEVTEYFLVGNFVSWTFALTTLAVIAHR
ncbi:hypothetical protein [Nocardioides sp. Kera G14]|uniref:hypothetical protein n=1 Tax=Nocardioides sp. Kera G14 TaxID=2884264 RepID=UPI001D12583D|nr:hypothetical protein [Nocardioides sp. Kera G14]UDY24932.1 hypothetical protein LH076_06475 [Nocardioides sp. Kera G14]